MKRTVPDDAASPPKRRQAANGSNQEQLLKNGAINGHKKKQILLNAFDMSTVGHLSPGQWKVDSQRHGSFEYS
jgi:hypothetical protein